MSKKLDAKKIEGMTKVMTVSTEGGAYCLTEFEIPTDILVKHSVTIKKDEPEIFAIVLMNMTKKAREILGI